MVSRLLIEKGVEDFISAATYFKNDLDITFTLVGLYKKNNKNYIRENILDNAIHDKVISYYPYTDDINNFFQKTTCIIHPSYREGLSTVLLEAAVLKKFTISTNCPTGPREILQDGKGGFLFTIGNYKSLSQKILNYHQNKKKLKVKINHNYKNLVRFDINKNLQKYYTEIKKYTD